MRHDQGTGEICNTRIISVTRALQVRRIASPHLTHLCTFSVRTADVLPPEHTQARGVKGTSRFSLRRPREFSDPPRNTLG